MLMVAACAKQGMPSGGPKDVTPPQTKGMYPANNGLHFSAQEFAIEFDEYVVLKEAENNVLVSPPMRQKPEYRTKGRSVVVKIKDTLQPNTTYLFQFRDAIADFNEGNLLPSLEYVFSTGDALDSMMVSGQVLDLLTGQPRKEAVSVLLLDSTQRGLMARALSDTAIHSATSAYMTRCDKDGNFSFNHIRPGRYFVVALEDGDKNLMVGASEAVAFSDSLWTAVAMPHKDTVAQVDSLKVQADSTRSAVTQPRGQLAPRKPIDSLHTAPQRTILNMFEPDNKTQRITSSDFKKAGVVRITTLLPMRAPKVDAGGEQVTWRLNAQRDTMTLWPLREKCDSLQLVVSDATGLQDTLRLRYRRQRSMGTPGSLPIPNAKFNIKDKLDFYDSLRVVFTVPRRQTTQRIDSAIVILQLKDSSTHYGALLMDSSLMKAAVDFGFLAGEKYQVGMQAGLTADIHNKGNDSLRAVFTVTKPEEYGNIKLKVSLQASVGAQQVLVQMLDEKGAVRDTKQVSASQELLFPHLRPGKYRFRAIFDTNGNGMWDSGDFGCLRQPERVLYYNKTIEVRANWDFEETWEVER